MSPGWRRSQLRLTRKLQITGASEPGMFVLRSRPGSATWVSAGHPARHLDRAAAAPGGQRARHARALPVPPGAPALLPGQELGEIKSWCSRVCPRHTSFPARGDSGSDGAPEKRGPP